MNKKKAARQLKARKFIFEILGNAICLDCSEKNWLVLTFDHREPSKKKYKIDRMIRDGMSIKTIKSELDKCDIVCQNCHSIRTQKMFGSWRLDESKLLAEPIVQDDIDASGQI